ncbi:hypothetical protein BpHYR1_051740 [Brachionus plicatilis]|uniref:Uncharacterized protein n=1 Tax=Brachionus plicatilis TaxID=10195 RepID=A0A3M7Q6F2_BRAPC|nr:hypothetical protein BpHYR1_051740 [Brachionus plicatilis]
MFLRCISKRKKKDIKMNRTLKIFVANSNVKFILKKKGKISMETVYCSFTFKMISKHQTKTRFLFYRP